MRKSAGGLFGEFQTTASTLELNDGLMATIEIMESIKDAMKHGLPKNRLRIHKKA